jgi:hypothetical protein
MTGSNIQSVFTGTITGANVLTITENTSGTVAANQYVVINGKVNFITNVNAGALTLQNSVSTTAVVSVYISYTLQTNPPKYTPTLKSVGSNLATVKWNINWNEVFGDKVGECRVRAKFISESYALLTWENNLGSIRVSLSSNSSNSTNAFNIGVVTPIKETLATYLNCDTLTSQGCSCIIPTNNQEFTVSILDNTENLMTNVPDYQLFLYFDVDDTSSHKK